MQNSSKLRVVAVVLVLCLAVAGRAADIGHVGVNQPVLVICVKYSDVATTRMTRCSDWRDLLTAQIRPFYDQATFGMSTLVFNTAPEGANNGWHDLGFARADYDFDRIVARAIDAVDPDINFATVNRILIITNNPDFGGQGDPGFYFWYPVDEGVEATFMEGGMMVGKRLMTAAIVNEWADGAGVTQDDGASVMAHELGHNLSLPTHYADIRWHPGVVRDVITPWDVMGFSPGLNHFIGWAKGERTWVPGTRTRTITAPADEVVTLGPLSQNTGATQLIRIPISTMPSFFGYVIENRRRLNGDDQIPSEGILLTLVDENPSTILKPIVLDDPDTPGDNNQAAREVTDTFTDASQGLTITYQSQTGDNARVRVQYTGPPDTRPNPYIRPWGAPPWETPDIWIDSEKNGLGTYRYTSGGLPSGNGDDAWVNHDNRLYVRVHNEGPGTATNVRVEVFVNSPPGMGDRGADWAYLGTVIFASIAATASAEDFVIWKPTVGEHTCVKAVILNLPGEVRTTDNLAQENVTAFDTTEGSPYRPVGLKVRVNNPFEDAETPVRFAVRDLPPGWGAMVEPPRMVLRPGGHDFVTFLVFPSGLDSQCDPKKPQQDDRNKVGFIGRPKIEAQVPYADTFIPIGGVEVWTHLVNPAFLDCAIEGAKRDDQKAVPGGTLIHPEPRPVVVSSKNAVVVTGRLTPALEGKIIAVEVTRDGKRVLEIVKTDAKGVYSAAFKRLSPGLWQAKAYFDGDDLYAKTESTACRLQSR